MRALTMIVVLLLCATAASADERSERINACVNWTDLEKSAVSCTELIRSNSFSKSDVAALFMNRGAIKARLNFYEEAKADLLYARHLNPGLEYIPYWLGFASLKAEEYQAAIEEYEAFLALKPDHTMARENYAIALWSAGEPDKAIAALTALTQHAPEHANGWFQRGKMRASLGQIKPAMDDFQKAMNIEERQEYKRCTAAALLALDDEKLGKNAAIDEECRVHIFAKPGGR